MKQVIVGHILFVVVFLSALSFRAPGLMFRGWSNVGLVVLNRSLIAASDESAQLLASRSEKLLQLAKSYEPESRSVWCGLGFALAIQGREEEAVEAWRTAGVKAETLIQRGEYARQTDDNEKALRWYNWAIKTEPDNELTWLKTGKFCQLSSMGNTKICQLFLNQNANNWLIDSDFAHNKIYVLWDMSEYQKIFTTWFPYEYQQEINYNFEPCPGLPDKQCAHILINAPVPANGGGLWQCLYLKTGEEYRYSGWFKVQVGQEGKWRPLYFEGDNQGRWPNGNYQTQSTDWSYWEYTFTAPALENNLVCFSPIRLESEGQVWFHSARLEMVQEP